MTEKEDVKKGRGTGWIIAAAAVYAWGLVILVQPSYGGDAASKGLAVAFSAALGTRGLLWGLRKRSEGQ